MALNTANQSIITANNQMFWH